MLPHLHLYGAAWGAAGLGFALGGALVLARRAPGGIAAARVAALLGATLASALLGARLHFLLLAPDLLRELGLRALVQPLGDGAGLRITGGLLAAGTVLVGPGPRVLGGALGRAALCDALVPLAGFAVALGRLGCFADGCCFGIPGAAPWCARFPAGSPAYWSHVAQGLVATSAPASLPVHPTQLYLAVAGLAASVASLAPRAGTLPDGGRALLFVLAMALLRALVEPLRESRFGAGVPCEVALDLAVAAAALVLLVLACRGRSAQRRALPVASGS